MVQVGPNTQLGGLKDGLLIVRYQDWTEEIVKKAPKPPAIWGRMRLMINLSVLVISYTVSSKVLNAMAFSWYLA